MFPNLFFIHQWCVILVLDLPCCVWIMRFLSQYYQSPFTSLPIFISEGLWLTSLQPCMIRQHSSIPCVSPAPAAIFFFALEFAWELLAPLFRLCSTSCLFSWTILQLGGGNSIAATSSFATQPCWAFSRRVRAFPLMACRYFHLLTHLVQVLLVGLAFLMFNLDVQKCSL